MNCFSRNFNFISLFLYFISIDVVIADQCPSAQIVKERKISREYDWSIDERRSLEDILTVEKLYSVRIKNRGEFIACYYTGNNRLLRLDGAALEKNCFIKNKSGNWMAAGKGEQICKEEDLSLCVYQIHCEEAN